MISRTTHHALAAFVVLAQAPSEVYLGSRQIASRIGAPTNYLGKLLRDFSNRGLLASRKGHSGGFRLAKPPETISLFQIADPIERFGAVTVCVLGNKKCSAAEPCPVHFHWQGARQAVISFLQNTNLRDAAGLSKSE